MNAATLRKYHAQLEDVLRAQLAELEATLQAATDVHRRIQAAADFEIARYLDDARQGLTADEAAARYADLDARAEIGRKAVKAINDARQRWEQKQAEVSDAARERKKMEILEKRQAQRRRDAATRAEQRVADEAAGRSHFVKAHKQQP